MVRFVNNMASKSSKHIKFMQKHHGGLPLSKRASLAEEEVQRLLLQILPGTPFEGKVFSIGGYERDKLIGKESKDLDIVVEISGGAKSLAKYIKSQFPNETSNPYQLGAAYPIWHIAFRKDVQLGDELYNTKGGEIDIADTQKETYPDPTSRQRETQFATLKEDVERRDFTVNMLLRDLSSGEVVDLTGVSADDIKQGILRGHPGISPDKMFTDDPLRMLRLIRFQCKYGWKVPLSMLRSVKNNAEQIEKISWERIQEELIKIMKLGRTDQAIKLMKATGLLPLVLPEIYGLIGVKHDPETHQEGDVYKHTLLVLSNAPPTIEGQLAALLHDVGKPQTQEFVGDRIRFFGHAEIGGEMAEAILRRLKFDNKTIKTVRHLVENHMQPHYLKDATPKALRKFVRKVGEEALEQVLELAEADALGKMPPENYIPELRNKIKEVMETPITTKPILNGKEIMELLNIKPGPKVGEVSRFLVDLQDEFASKKKKLTKEVAKQKILEKFSKVSGIYLSARHKSNISRFYRKDKKINLSKRDFIKEGGMFEPPPKMVEAIWKWALPRYAAIVYENSKDIRLKEVAGQDCNFKPEQYYDFSTNIPIQIEGWKYEDEEFTEALEQWKGMFDEIKVNIYSMHEEDSDYIAQYTDNNNQVDIIFYIEWLTPRTLREYDNIKGSIYKTIEHELIHVGQYIFKHFKNLKDYGGLPSSSIRDSKYSSEGQLYLAPINEKEYYTRDIEFYALLNDEAIRLQNVLSRFPAQSHDEVFKSFVGIIESPYASTFLKTLKQQEPQKWQKAVKELYKSIPKISLAKRAAEYVEKKEEESGNITYIYSDKHIKKRNKQKAKKVRKLADSIKDLKAQVVKDLKDDKLKNPALAVALIINTYERVGNPKSSEERDTHGVTTWKKKHISFPNNKARIKYKGKAGVQQDKEVKPAYLVKELKEITKDLKPNDEIFPELTSNDVNKYLSKFKITAKDIRGFFANHEMIKALKKLQTAKNEKLRKEKFKKALEQTAKIVGHNPSTLKNQYLIPSIEENYIENNKITGIQAKASLSKRVALDLREYFPLSTFGSMMSEKTPWFITQYEPDGIKASLRFKDGLTASMDMKLYGNTMFVMFMVPKYLGIGKPCSERKSSITFPYFKLEEMNNYFPQIHDLIAEITIMKEQEKDIKSSVIQAKLPPELFRGWDRVTYGKNFVMATIEKPSVQLLVNKGINTFTVNLNGTRSEFNFKDFPPEKLIEIIKRHGKQNQPIVLEESLRISKRASKVPSVIEKHFPFWYPQMFGGWKYVDAFDLSAASWPTIQAHITFGTLWGGFYAKRKWDEINGHIEWPSQLGDLHLGLEPSPYGNYYEIKITNDNVNEIPNITSKLGTFGESLTQHPSLDFVPEGKTYSPDITEYFPEELFSKWGDLKVSKHKSTMENMSPPYFRAEINGSIVTIHIVFYDYDVPIPDNLSEYAEITRDGELFIRSDMQIVKPLIPDIIQLINKISKEIK